MELYNIVTKQYHRIRRELETYSRDELSGLANDLVQEYIESPRAFMMQYGESLTDYVDVYIDSFNRCYDYMTIQYCNQRDAYSLLVKGAFNGVLKNGSDEYGLYTAHELLEYVIGEMFISSKETHEKTIEMIAQLQLHKIAMSEHGRLVQVCETVQEAKEMLFTGRATKVAIGIEEIIEEYFSRHAPNVYETLGGPLDVFQVADENIFPMENFDEWVDVELRPYMSWTEIYDIMNPSFDTRDEYVDASFKGEIVSMTGSGAEELAQEIYIDRPVEVMKKLYETCDPEGIENYIVEEMLPALGLLDTQTVVLLDW